MSRNERRASRKDFSVSPSSLAQGSAIGNISTTFAEARLHLEQDMQAVGAHVEEICPSRTE